MPPTRLALSLILVAASTAIRAQDPPEIGREARESAPVRIPAAELAQLRAEVARLRELAEQAAELARQSAESAAALQRRIDGHLGAVDAPLPAASPTADAATAQHAAFVARIEAALTQPAPGDVVRELRSLREEATRDPRPPQPPGAAPLIAIVNFRLAQTIANQASGLMTSTVGQGANAIGQLRDAHAIFRSVLEAPDGAERTIATSLHAASLARMTRVSAIEARFYGKLATARNNKEALANADRCWDAAEKHVEHLTRAFPKAKFADGTSCVAKATEEIEDRPRRR